MTYSFSWIISREVFLHFGTRNLTAEFLLSVVFFRKRTYFPESLLFAVIIDMQNLFQEFFRLVIIINTDFKGFNY